MSYQEKINFIKYLREALHSYQGFTQAEKEYAYQNLPKWVGPNGELDMFIKKFAEHFLLDVRPFLFDKQIISK